MAIGSYGKKREKSRRQKCKENIEHTLMFDYSDENGQTWWQCEFCERIFRFNKEK